MRSYAVCTHRRSAASAWQPSAHALSRQRRDAMRMHGAHAATRDFIIGHNEFRRSAVAVRFAVVGVPMNPFRSMIALLAGMLLCLPLLAFAQYPPPNQAPPQPYTQPPPQQLSQDQLDGLLAPIALYPDELLTQVLMASTYPLEVVEAARFVKANPALRGPALDDALKDKTWDPSVLSLAPFPQVLDMMNDKLEWTQRLGDAFLADEAGVMRTVQMLRQRAQQAGNLQSNEQQRVYVQDQVRSSSSPRNRSTSTCPCTTRRSSTVRGGRPRIARGTGIRRRSGATRRRRRRGGTPRDSTGAARGRCTEAIGGGRVRTGRATTSTSTST